MKPLFPNLSSSSSSSSSASSPAFGEVTFRFPGGGVFVIYATVSTAYIGAICGVVFSLILVIAGAVFVFIKGKGRDANEEKRNGLDG